MSFKLIDLSTWNRKEYFDHYLHEVPCFYSMTLNLNITHLHKAIKAKNIKLYPVTIYLLSLIVNQHEEFRMAIDKNGNVGRFDLLHPSYTIFQKEGETFTNIWTEYSADFQKFYDAYLRDVEKYGDVKSFLAKPNEPDNIFTVSSIPWVSFTGFNLNLPKGNSYLLPIFTTGKFFEQNGQILLPFAIQIHHAVCDGYHVAKFIGDLQAAIDQFQ